MGFYKTHSGAAEACLAAAGGSIQLGTYLTISSVTQFEGLLWGSPAMCGDTHRTQLQQDLFLLARQTLVARCNELLFGTSSGGLVAEADAALSGTNCSDILSIEAQVDAFNNSGDSVSISTTYTNDRVANTTDPSCSAGVTGSCTSTGQ